MPRLRLAIVSTHPIQYYAPVFRALAASTELEVRVFYTWSQAADAMIFDPGFGAFVKWDVPLLDGYRYQFVPNVARNPGLGHFRGLKTPALAGEIEKWKADAVLIYTWNSEAHLRALRHFKGRLPVLFRGDSTLLDELPWWRTQLRRIALRWIYRHVDMAIAVGTNNRDYFLWSGVASERIAVAPHSVDTRRFAADSNGHENRAASWKTALRIDPDAVVLLFAGKLQSKKNPHLLLEAFSSLDVGAHLIFVGNGDLDGSLRSRAASMGNVHFMPFQNQSLMPAVYRLGDVFVLPSQGPEETWGLALNEAMASGRPVIASTKVGGARDLIRPEHNGWIFESGNVQDLRRVLRQAIARTKGGLHALGAAAQLDNAAFSSEESARRIGDAVLSITRRVRHGPVAATPPATS